MDYVKPIRLENGSYLYRSNKKVHYENNNQLFSEIVSRNDNEKIVEEK